MIVSPVSALVKLSVNGCLFLTATINLSVILIDILAFVTLSRSDFTPINSSKSGCSHDSESINAPLRPFCPINPVTNEYKSMKLTEPEVALAVLFTFAPLGARLLISTPQPPPYEYVRASLEAHSNIDSILSSGGVIT